MDKLNDQSNGNIGAREFGAIIILTLSTKATDFTTSILFEDGYNAAWMIPIVSVLFLIGPLLILYKLLKEYQSKNLIELINEILGRKIGSLIGILLLFLGLAATVFDSRSYVEIVGRLYYPQTPTIVLYSMLLGVSFYIAKHGLETIGRVAVLSFPYIKAMIVLLVVLVLKDVKWGRIFPISGAGWTDIVQTGFFKQSIFADMFYFSLFYPFLKNDKSFKKGGLISFGIVIVEFVFFLILYVGIFEYPTVQQITFHFHELIRYVEVGPYFTNLEIIYFIFWMVGAFIRFAIYLYMISLLFGTIFKIKEFEPLILSVSALVLLLGMLPNNLVTNSYLLWNSYLLPTISVTIPVLIFLLWGVSKIRGGAKR
ncbi:endospore germination permease [Bacillaceae bacterium S4-13-56]